MFTFKKKNDKSDAKNGIVAAISLAVGSIFLFIRRASLRQFLKREKKEIKQLSQGQQSIGKFCQDSSKILKDFFIPHEGNNHKPKSLRPKVLASYVAAVVAIKVLVTGFLFLTYPDPAALSEIVASKMIKLINESREDSGVPVIASNDSLVAAAIEKGKDMLDKQYFAHDSPDGKKPWQWINRAQYDYVYAGENLAIDFNSAEVVHEAFMKSPSHQRNILNPKYREVGIAVISGEVQNRKTILLVEFFGTQRKDLTNLAAATPPPAPSTVTVTPPEKPKPQPSTNTAPTPVLQQPMVPEKPVVAAEQLDDGQAVNQPVADYNNEAIIVVNAKQAGKTAIDYIIEYSNIFFLAFLIYLIIMLLLNIFIKIKVQHTAVILQTVVVIALVASMILFKFHFVETIATQTLIL